MIRQILQNDIDSNKPKIKMAQLNSQVIQVKNTDLTILQWCAHLCKGQYFFIAYNRVSCCLQMTTYSNLQMVHNEMTHFQRNKSVSVCYFLNFIIWHLPSSMWYTAEKENLDRLLPRCQTLVAPFLNGYLTVKLDKTWTQMNDWQVWISRPIFQVPTALFFS